jgi:glycosyltransferase involved in cell wall biosynthesis
MRIIIDLQSCQSTGNRSRGIGRYSLNLAKAMVKLSSRHEFWVLMNGQLLEGRDEIKSAFYNLLPPERFLTFQVPTPAAEMSGQNLWRTSAAEKVREFAIAHIKPDILHMTSLFEGFIDDAVTSVAAAPAPYPTAVTLYDLIPLAWPEAYLQDARMRQWYERKLAYLEKSSLLLSISEHSRQEVISRLNFSQEKVFNISAAVDNYFKVISISEEQTKNIQSQYGIGKPFVMYTGGIDHRKNIETLIEAYAGLPVEIRRTHQLLIVCSIQFHDRERLGKLSRKKGLSDEDIRFTGYVSDEDLRILYNLCKLFVFPSLDEGFGLPPLEAMACGAPVIASNVSSLPEVIGRQDAMFDPSSAQSITSAIYNALIDSNFLADLRDHATDQSKLFSWEKSAACAVEALDLTYRRHSSQQISHVPIPKPKPYLAFVSPLPPLSSGIADYSAELIPELSALYNIVLITDQPKVIANVLSPDIPTKSIDWFQKNAHSFDRIVYQFGNSAFHWHMFDLLSQYPGVVVLHDFYLSSIVSWMAIGGVSANSFAKSLYDSHGYSALVDLNRNDTEHCIWTYPCNKTVLDKATGVIVHSNHAKELARRYFKPYVSNEWFLIPQLYKPPVEVNHQAARLALGFSEDDFVVCSFGSLGPTKLSKQLLKAWIASDISADRQCYLIFVGQNSGDESYGRFLVRQIQESGHQTHIKITGFLDGEEYRRYLSAADTVVQLRTLSRGETSRAILETLSYGIPLIANDHGSIQDYPDDILVHLKDDFSNDELISALKKCRNDKNFRHEMSRRAQRHVIEHHSPASAASFYYEAIEEVSASGPYSHYKALLDSLSKIDVKPKPDETDLIKTAEAIVSNSQRSSVYQLLVDISELVQRDAKTGIQRVVRSVLNIMLYNDQMDYRVEPVYFDGENYRYARHFATALLGVPSEDFDDDIIDVASQDVFLGLDLSLEFLSQRRERLSLFSQQDVKINFVVHDILLLQHPEWWPPEGGERFREWFETVALISDNLVCTSQTGAESVKSWVKENLPGHLENLSVTYFHLGADIESSFPTKGIPQKSVKLISCMQASVTFLMVGTLEPRKGHSQTLKAFELLWLEGLDVNLVIVGKQGWMVDDLVKSIKYHPQLNKRLFWLEGISDEYLEQIYVSTTAYLAASEGEGFGLPLIEAARHKIPIVSRSLPIFRDIAGNHAFYFEGNQPEQLATALNNWINLYRAGEAPSSANMPWLTWTESTQQLLNAILPKREEVS